MTDVGAAVGGDPQGGWANFWVHESAFTEQECDLLVSLGEAALPAGGAEDASIEGLADGAELRDSRIGWLPRAETTAWAFERLEQIAAVANTSWGLATDGIIEDLQYTLYDTAGSHYTWHHDGLEAGVDDRKVSLVLQLSDPDSYRGADLEFLEVAADYDDAERAEFSGRSRARGTVMAFCSFEYHRVTPLESGLRRSLVAWVSGPRLR
ncbi:MAG: 2OG-Fe(II) oxygenase [Microthrixaceae bacterium]